MLKSASFAYTKIQHQHVSVGKSSFSTAMAVALVVLTNAPALEAQAAAPLAPVNFQAISSGLQVTFAWQANPQGPAQTSFALLAGSGPGLSDLAILQLPGNQNAFTTGAPPGTYYVRIVAVNGVGPSAASNEVIVTIGGTGGGGGCPLPAAPTGLSAATTTPGSVTIRWTASAGATAYVLDVGSVPGAANLGSFPLGNRTNLTSPAPAGMYFARLRALNDCGSSAPSAELNFTIGAVVQASLPAGTYIGTMSNSLRAGLGRPPISSFQLTLNQATPSVQTQISARWSDNAGCVRTTFIYGGNTSLGLSIDIEQLTCHDGDLILRVTSIAGNVVSGTCNGSASCTFRMVRQ